MTDGINRQAPDQKPEIDQSESNSDREVRLGIETAFTTIIFHSEISKQAGRERLLNLLRNLNTQQLRKVQQVIDSIIGEREARQS